MVRIVVDPTELGDDAQEVELVDASGKLLGRFVRAAAGGGWTEEEIEDAIRARDRARGKGGKTTDEMLRSIERRLQD